MLFHISKELSYFQCQKFYRLLRFSTLLCSSKSWLILLLFQVMAILASYKSCILSQIQGLGNFVTKSKSWLFSQVPSHGIFSSSKSWHFLKFQVMVFFTIFSSSKSWLFSLVPKSWYFLKFQVMAMFACSNSWLCLHVQKHDNFLKLRVMAIFENLIESKKKEHNFQEHLSTHTSSLNFCFYVGVLCWKRLHVGPHDWQLRMRSAQVSITSKIF